MGTSIFPRHNTARRSAAHFSIASRNSGLIVKFLRVLMISLTWLSIGACDQSYQPRGPVERSWTEDVLLEDGSTILVQRHVAFRETNAWPSGGAYNAVETTSVIRFTGRLINLPPWSQPLRALLLYQDQATKEWTVVATSTSCEVWRRRNKPKPPYWEFRAVNGSWREIPLSAASIGRPTNLLRRYQAKPDAAHITVGERRRLDGTPPPDRPYKEIWGDPDQRVCGEGNLDK